MTDVPFEQLPDLASRAIGGSVVFANDELFAQRENLITPGAAAFDVRDFGHKGKVYDGWETRRRREPGHDHAIVRLGVPGRIAGVIVDTAWFTGNYPPEASVEAVLAPADISPAELAELEWTTLVARTGVQGDTANRYEVADERRWSHVRLSIYPDGGVARFRVHGTPLPDPRLLEGTIDLAAIENGGVVIDCSNRFYSSPDNLLLPGPARSMGEGWENARRRGDGNDYVVVRLAAAGLVRRVELDTSYFVGNAPGWARVSVRAGDEPWRELVARTRLQPDTRHFFVVDDQTPSTELRVDVYPDGGMARVRVMGELVTSAD